MKNDEYRVIYDKKNGLTGIDTPWMPKSLVVKEVERINSNKNLSIKKIQRKIITDVTSEFSDISNKEE